MNNYPIFTRTLMVAAPTCAVVPVAGLFIGVVAALLLIMMVTV